MVGECESVEEIGEFMIGLSLFALAIAVDSLFEVLDAFVDLILIDALLADHEVSGAGFAVILMHH